MNKFLITIFFFILNVYQSFGYGQWICEGLIHGSLIPNPYDCTSYYVCNYGIPVKVQCRGNLHFDVEFKVCNWPDKAKCELGKYPPNWFTSTTENDDVTASSESTNTTPSVECTTVLGKATPDPPIPKNSTTGAKDEEGNEIDPMKKYNPKKVSCLHSGLYFLPHPRSCENYFICSDSVLYMHACGKGVHWNFEENRCDKAEQVKCYGNRGKPTSTTITTTEPTKTETIIQSTKTRKPPVRSSSSSVLPETTHDHRNDLPNCPVTGQKFFPHPKDCNKYFICIAGIPVLTKCPPGYLWEELLEQCSLSKYVFCRSGQKTEN